MNKYLLLIIIFFIASTVYAIPTHTYPLIGIQTFGGAVTDWYAKHDLVIIPQNNASLVREIKTLNPDTVVLYSSDWNHGIRDAGVSIVGSFPDAWYVRNSNNQKIQIYGPDDFLIDVSDLCTPYNGQKFNQALAEYLANNVDLTAFDGYFSQGSWETPWMGARYDIDLDKNGINDYSEHGRGWVQDQWSGGQESLLSNLRSLIPQDKIIVINSGLIHDFGMSQSNGFELEHMSHACFNWTYTKQRYDDWIENGRKPGFSLMDATEDYDSIHAHSNPKNNFRLMRFLLTFTMLGNAYFDFEATRTEHYIYRYYDEYDLDLGFPSSEEHSIFCDRVQWYDQCIWVRFFDKGAVIHNAKGLPFTVTDDDIKALTGYNGPYYRFQGAQDPDFNNGQTFTSVNLWGAQDDPNCEVKLFGDGIILLKEPQVVASDIVIDNVDYGTSPASETVQLIGNWTQTDKNEGGPSYTLSHAIWIGVYKYAYTNSKNEQAVFRPSIGAEGTYKVYEWHGWHGSSIGGEATNVGYEIGYSNGSETVTVNQQQNHGQWNLLGEYYFNRGDGYVKINTNNTNGTVIADAVKFVYQEPDELIPDFNCDNQVDIFDFGILLSHWGQSADLDLYNNYQCASLKNIDIQGNNKIDGLDFLKLFSCWGKPSSGDCYK